MIVYELPSANIRINRARLTSSAGRVRDRRRAVSSSLSGTFNSKLDLSISHRAFTHGQEWSRNHWYAPLVAPPLENLRAPRRAAQKPGDAARKVDAGWPSRNLPWVLRHASETR